MKKRLPSNVSQLDSLSELASSSVLQQNKALLQRLSFISLFVGDLEKLDTQWQMIGTSEWKDVTDLSTEEFWVQVLQYKDTADENYLRNWQNLLLH